MGRGKGLKRRMCYCMMCHENFLSSREDAITCSPRCRKARNRLLGGPVTSLADPAPPAITKSVTTENCNEPQDFPRIDAAR